MTWYHLSFLAVSVAMLGMTAGPLFSGVMFDLIGDYRAAFLVLAAMAALGSIAALLARKPTGACRGVGPCR